MTLDTWTYKQLEIYDDAMQGFDRLNEYMEDLGSEFITRLGRGYVVKFDLMKFKSATSTDADHSDVEPFSDEWFEAEAKSLLVNRALAKIGDARAMVAFMGTDPFEGETESPRELAKLLSWFFGWAFNIMPTYSHTRSFYQEVAGHGFDFPGVVHPGFYALLALQNWAQICDVAREAAKPGLILTGHSQGGAIAALAAYRLVSEGFNVRAVYTFGAPRVGDATFRNAYDSRVKHYRFEYIGDLVPFILPPPGDARPLVDHLCSLLRLIGLGELAGAVKEFLAEGNPDRLNYRHVGQLILTDWDGGFIPNPSARVDDPIGEFIKILNDPRPGERMLPSHGMDTYVNHISALLDRYPSGFFHP